VVLGWSEGLLMLPLLELGEVEVLLELLAEGEVEEVLLAELLLEEGVFL
jgi:hypothetical protein